MSVFDEIAEVIGDSGARTIRSVFGCQRMYVPRKLPAPESRLVASVGRMLGEIIVGRLVERFGGEYIDVPPPDFSAERDIEIRRLVREDKLTLNEVGARYQIGRRRLLQILRDA